MKQELQVMAVTANVLNFCATLFTFFGIVMFAYLYLSHYRDDPLRALTDPVFVVTILIPFLPAAVMSWAAARKRKQIKALLEQSGQQPST